MELLAMLFGLALLIIAGVVFSAYQSAENTVLLRSKYRAEIDSRSGGFSPVAGREIAGWQRRDAALYGSGSRSVTIPFTSGDRPRYAQTNSIESVNSELTSASRSAAEKYTYEPLYPSRFGLRENELEGLSTLSTFDAAHLLARRGDDHSTTNGKVSGDRLYNSGLLVDVFRKVIGRLPSPDDNESSEVLLPLRDEIEEE